MDGRNNISRSIFFALGEGGDGTSLFPFLSHSGASGVYLISGLGWNNPEKEIDVRFLISREERHKVMGDRGAQLPFAL
jgi:hypothetical protein